MNEAIARIVAQRIQTLGSSTAAAQALQRLLGHRLAPTPAMLQ